MIITVMRIPNAPRLFAASLLTVAVHAQAQQTDLSLTIGLADTDVARGEPIEVGYVVGNPTPNPVARYRIEWFATLDPFLDSQDIALGETQSTREVIANSFQEDSARLDSCPLTEGPWRIIGRLVDVVPADENPSNDVALAADTLRIGPGPGSGGPDCPDASPPRQFINPGLNDAWFDSSAPGQGLLLSVYPDARVVFAAWFTFDADTAPRADTAVALGAPGQRWLTAQGGWSGNRATLSIVNSSGGVFNRGEPSVTSDADYGEMVLEVRDCTAIDMSYDLPAAGRSGAIRLTRVVGNNLALCEALAEPGGDAPATTSGPLRSR